MGVKTFGMEKRNSKSGEIHANSDAGHRNRASSLRRAGLRTSKVALVLKVPQKFIHKLIDYDGFGASLVKAFVVVLMWACIFYPWWSYPLWLMLSLRLPPLLQYVAFALWLIQWVLIIGAAAYVQWKMSS